jgi:hypothetical protein
MTASLSVGDPAAIASSGPVFLLFLLRVDLEAGHAVRVLLRAAMLSDLSALVEVQRSSAVLALGEVFPQDAYPFPTEGIRARWVAELADPQIDAYVVVDGEGPWRVSLLPVAPNCCTSARRSRPGGPGWRRRRSPRSWTGWSLPGWRWLGCGSLRRTAGRVASTRSRVGGDLAAGPDVVPTASGAGGVRAATSDR